MELRVERVLFEAQRSDEEIVLAMVERGLREAQGCRLQIGVFQPAIGEPDLSLGLAQERETHLELHVKLLLANDGRDDILVKQRLALGIAFL